MKKILVVTPFFAPHIGGSQQYMEDLYATLLKAHSDLSVDVFCYNTNAASNEENYRGMHVYRIPCLNILPGQFALPNPFVVLSFFYTHRNYDLIHVSTRFFDTAWYMPLIAKVLRIPIIMTDHCAFHPVHKSRLVSGLSKWLDLTLVRFCMHFYKTIFATNKATQAFLKTALHIDSTVMYGGVDTDKFVPKAKKEGTRLKVTYVGRMIPSKGVELFFTVAKKHTEFDFIFAGPGELVQSLQERVKNENISHISIEGGKNKEDVIQLLRETDIFVHPSYHHEGFPNILLEAGAMGLPTIATDTGGTKELIINNKTGLLIPMRDENALEDALVRLGKDRSLRVKLAEGLYKNVQKNFSWKEISEKHYTFLQTLVSS